MTIRIYKIVLELEDHSDSDGEDLELAVEEALAYLPDDLTAHVIECIEADDENF